MRQVPMKHFLALLCLFFTLTAKSHSSDNELHFNFPDVQIGIAENPAGPTGMTLFYFPGGAQAAVDIRGGSVGTFFTSEKMHQGDAYIDGVAFCGGGILGMEAITGAISGLFQQKKSAQFVNMPLITGAVIFDYTPRNNQIYPDKALGVTALKNLKTGSFKQGPHGAGIAATIEKLFGNSFHPAGQGGAFAEIGKTKIAVFTVVNAVGVVLNEKGENIHDASEMGSKGKIQQKAQDLLLLEKLPFNPSPKNTTLTLVVINEKLSPRHLQQIGRQVQHALSQVIYPYASILDGDVLYTVSTGTVESDLHSPGSKIATDMNGKFIYLGMVAGELAKQAVWEAVGYQPER